MTHLRLQSKNDFEPEIISQTDSLHDSNVNHALIAIAQEVAELLKQAYPVQLDEIDAEDRAEADRNLYTFNQRIKI